jgi:hypothetical protein
MSRHKPALQTLVSDIPSAVRGSFAMYWALNHSSLSIEDGIRFRNALE